MNTNMELLTDLKQYATSPIILSSIQIATIKAAIKFNKGDAASGVVDLLNRILNNPEDIEWCKAIAYCVVCGNTDVQWDEFQQNQEDIEDELESLCSEAITVIGS